MIKFKLPTSTVCTTHLAFQRKHILGIIDKSGYSANAETGYSVADEIISFLKLELDDILIGSPKKIEEIVTKFEAAFPDFSRYCHLNPKKNDDDNYDAATHALREHLSHIFDYDRFSRSTTKGAYWLVKGYGKRICPYCQLHHINYHFTDTKSFKLRPPLDHFYPQSRYPYLGVSISNLIPSCAQCNSGVKLNNDPRAVGLPHPLQSNPPVNVKFDFSLYTAQLRVRSDADFGMQLESNDAPTKAHIEFFKLEERYKWYMPEVIDLFFRNAKYYQFHSELRSVMPRDEFLLGFAKKNVSDRVLGNCLDALVDWLPEATSKNST